MFCCKCGKEIREENRFCDRCGYEVKKRTSETKENGNGKTDMKNAVTIAVVMIGLLVATALITAITSAVEVASGYLNAVERIQSNAEAMTGESMAAVIIQIIWALINGGY